MSGRKVGCRDWTRGDAAMISNLEILASSKPPIAPASTRHGPRLIVVPLRFAPIDFFDLPLSLTITKRVSALTLSIGPIQRGGHAARHLCVLPPMYMALVTLSKPS